MASTNYNPRIQYLTDEIIDTYAGQNVLTTYKDVDKRVRYYDEYVPGGVLDGLIFGSMFAKQCNCGRRRRADGRVCPVCKSILLEEPVSWRRYAKIELPVYYVSSIRKKNFYSFMYNNFIFKFNCSDEFMEMVTGRKRDRDLVFDFCQFSYDEEQNCIIVTDQITDPNLCSYEGLIQIIMSHYPQHMVTFKQFINSSVLVIPMPARAPRYVYEKNQKVLQNHQITSIYKCIIRACTQYYEMASDKCTDPVEIALLRANLRRYVAKNFDLVSQLLKPSKQNLSRMMQSHRLTNSGRCTIVPAPELKVDEVSVPRHLMYEACRDEFIDYLAQTNNWSHHKATDTYVNEANSPEIQKQFDEYIDHGNNGMGKYVIINRNPTLYELGMFACKVKLTNNYTMGLPLLLCSPLGGDFDGDSMSFYAVPDDIAPEIVSKMSPKNLIYYKKNQKPLYTPSHEMMAGLLIATKQIEDPEGRLRFESYDEANEYRKKNKNFKWQTKCIIKIDEEYTETTLGRAKLSQLFNKNIDEFLGANKADALTSDLVITLYDNLAELDDRVERIQAIQEFALSISTMAGSTAPKLSDLHANLDPIYLDRIKEIESSDKLSDSEKDIKIREIFDEFVEHSRFEYDENGNPVVDVDGKKVPAVDENGNPRISIEVRRQVSESSRAKESQLLSMVMPQLNVGTDKIAHVGRSSLIQGMTPTDYVRHSIENRLVQDIKQSATPRSGYTTRQLVTLGASFFYTEEEDPKNKGILIPKRKASGRTMIDGTVISRQEAKNAKKDEMVRVRSIITCTNPDKSKIPGDCISKVNKWKEGDNVGISLLSSLTEGLTQAGLSLKHGGSLFESDKLSCIKAPENGTAQLLENFVVFKGDSGKEYTYPKSSNFVLNYTPSGKYNMGEVIGVAYRLFTPSYRLDSIISLIGAAGTSSQKKLLNNNVLVTECYAYGDGKIKYNVVKGSISNVQIGDYVYSYNDQACYFLPEGTEVKAGQRFCTGLLDLDKAISKLHNYLKIFDLFSLQFDELIPGMQSELIEMVYSIIVRNINGAIKHTNVRAAVRQTGSLYTNMAFMDTKSVLANIPVKGMEFMMDSFSSILLPSFFFNDI